MDHLWLDSLSEDWVSQPGSEEPSAIQLPPLKPSLQTGISPSPKPSRIPRRLQGPGAGLISSPLAAHDNSISILGERSANDINIARQRLSRLAQAHGRKQSQGRVAARSVSSGTTGSVVHNTVQQNSSSDARSDTPEWKRRLVYGDIQYGEQRDLFESAANGLQDMFKPPPSGDIRVMDNNEIPRNETTLPSSPPVYNDIIDPELEAHLDLDEEDDYPDQITPSPSPRRPQREIKYKLTLDDALNSSTMSNDSIRRGPPAKPPPPAPPKEDSIYRDSSCLSIPSQTNTTYRKISEMRHEDFSPIFIGKHNNEDGKVDYAPLEIPAAELRQRLERLRRNQMIVDPGVDGNTDLDEPHEVSHIKIENSDDYARSGGYINLRRGGRSDEGSFRLRPLSPELGVDSSDMLPEESLQASTPKQFPTMRLQYSHSQSLGDSLASPSLPRAPFPSPEKRRIRDDAFTQSTGSPLKLFGPYDTFTNQTLLRRISQFEESMSGRTSRQSSAPITRGELNLRVSRAILVPRSRAVSHFGGRELDAFDFSADLSQITLEDSISPDEEHVSPRPFLMPMMPFHSSDPVLSPDQDSELQVRRRRQKSITLPAADDNDDDSLASLRLRLSLSPPKGAPQIAGTPKRDTGSDKRPRTSPSKDPTPKRRRTLHKADIALAKKQQLAAVDTAHQKIQRAMMQYPASFLLSPMGSIPSQQTVLRMASSVHAHESLQPPPRVMQSVLPNRELSRSSTRHKHDEPRVPGAIPSGDRKPSIRTQDFVDQAAQIMAMIRNQVSQPVLASLEESEVEIGSGTQIDFAIDDASDESNEPLSRPPSRDGKPVSRLPHRQQDPELLQRLKKYQEFGDMGDVISSSVRSMGLAKDAIRAAQEVERMIEQTSRGRYELPQPTEGDLTSDLPNVRISVNPSMTDELVVHGQDYNTISSTRSANNSFPSGSSRNSESRRIIMPESVCHLIPDRIGGMFLDKQNNIWIKNKQTPSTSSFVGFDDSEDDPFASIPDLTVDVTKEMQQLRLIGNLQLSSTDPSRDVTAEEPSFNNSQTSCDEQCLDPTMAVRAIKELQKLGQSGDNMVEQVPVEEREGEIQDDMISNPTSTTRRRNLAITFSSPVASIIQEVLPEDLDSLEDDPDASEFMQNHTASPTDSPLQTPTARSASRSHGPTGGRPQANRVPTDGSFAPRPVSRIDEQDEESTVEIPVSREPEQQLSIIGDRSLLSHKSPNGNLGFFMNRTPGHKALTLQGDESLVIGQNIGRLSLSPLSEFTLNNIDRSFGFEVSYVMGQRHMATGDGSKRVLSMTIRELVDKLAEVEPFEPYWEDMTELNLQGKKLTSLHMLDEFCNKIVTLDASNNALAHLTGVPTCVRQLKVSHNMLTELTSWDHLVNLQYIDISGNEVKSLSALKGLVHLRSIRADNNKLTSLDGLDCHDGLLTLRARDNLIEELDFADMKLERLEEIDLAGNAISSIRGLQMLPALSRLNLAMNQLRILIFEKSIMTLRHLDIGDNDLTSLDVRNLPNLYTLHADRNRIHDLSGLRHARRLDSLSLREQRLDTSLDLGFLASACEIRKLFLSGNYLKCFEPRTDFLNLQYLELANCGLERLPKNLGQLMPNLRILNLNLNAIADLSCLRFIPRLKKLLVAGNRLMDSTLVTELLTDFPHLTQLDLRDNPITQGFYAPVQMLLNPEKVGPVDPFSLPDVDVDRDALFARRLDEATKLRRRLHQVVFIASCKRLKKLDGLGLKRNDVLVRDSLLQTLIDEGLMPELEDTLVAESETTPRHSMSLTPQRRTPRRIPGHLTSERSSSEHIETRAEEPQSGLWHAEDSFA